MEVKGGDVAQALALGLLVFIMAYLLLGGKGQAKEGIMNRSSERKAGELIAREPAVAGQFYPKDPGQLRDAIEGYLDAAPDFPEVYGIRGLVSPHAGYVYSGPTAAYGYKQLRRQRFETVIILAPSHRHYFSGASIADVDVYRTPLGDVEVSPKVEKMLAEDIFSYVPAAHAREHSLEVQVPFLQVVLPPFKIIPIVVGDADPAKLADALEGYIDDDTLVVASTDLSHFDDYETARGKDSTTCDAIVALDLRAMAKDGDACGKTPAMTLMELAKRRGLRTRLFDYRNSGDTAGDRSRVVGYASIGLYDGLDQDEQKMLLDIAWKTLRAHYRGERYELDEASLPPRLLEEKACFVTLNKDKRLRGCIGHLSARVKLFECVQENALNAALRDSRFRQVTETELADIKVEISVLSEPKPLSYDSPDDLLQKLIPEVDGVIIKRGMRSSTYLPVVWEQLPDKEEFLSRLCEKQGSGPDCWKLEGTVIETYQAQEFHEQGFK